VRGLSSHFVWTNRSKESLTLDLKQPVALQVLARLLESADVLVQNLAPGAAARLGLGHETLRGRHPRLIVCDISGYGDDPAQPGPYRDKKAYDLLIQSEAGFLSVTGTPTPASWPRCCSAAAPAAAAASTSRCSRRRRNGWAFRCTTPSTAPPRRRAPGRRTRRSIPTAPSRPATGRS
jgi:itaconate CoA-transferase